MFYKQRELRTIAEDLKEAEYAKRYGYKKRFGGKKLAFVFVRR